MIWLAFPAQGLSVFLYDSTGHLYARNEAFAREAELRLGETLIKGRHNRAAAAILRVQGKEEVADAIESNGLTTGTPGRAKASHDEEQANQRIKVGQDILAALLTAWTDQDPFVLALAAVGCVVEKRPTDKTHQVYRIEDDKRLGDLTRMLRNAGVAGITRAKVDARMKAEAAAATLAERCVKEKDLDRERVILEKMVDPALLEQKYVEADEEGAANRAPLIEKRSIIRTELENVETLVQPSTPRIQNVAIKPELDERVETSRAALAEIDQALKDEDWRVEERKAHWLSRHMFARTVIGLGEIVWTLARKLIKAVKSIVGGAISLMSAGAAAVLAMSGMDSTVRVSPSSAVHRADATRLRPIGMAKEPVAR